MVSIDEMRFEGGRTADQAFVDADVCASVVRQFSDAARIGIGKGAEAIVPAGGIFMTVLAHAGVHAVDGVPIVNGLIALLKMAEMAVKLADPQSFASDQVVNLSGAIRREIASMGDGIERALARAGELARYGLAIEPFGPGAVAVRETPSMLGEIDVTLKRERQPGEYREALVLLRERLTEMNQIADDLTLLVRAQERKSVPLVEVPLDAVLATVATVWPSMLNV